jgi:hypothetical protein
MTFLELVPLFTGLIGWPALVTALVNVGKTVKIVRDGTAASWSLVLNVLGFGLMYAGVITGVDFAEIDATFGALATALVAISTFMVQLGVSSRLHQFVRGIPILGAAFSE